MFRVPQAGQTTELAKSHTVLRKRVRQKPQVSSHATPRTTQTSERHPVTSTGLIASTLSCPMPLIFADSVLAGRTLNCLRTQARERIARTI